MRPKTTWDAVLNALLSAVFALLLLHMLEPGTLEVPMPGDDKTQIPQGDDGVPFPFA